MVIKQKSPVTSKDAISQRSVESVREAMKNQNDVERDILRRLHKNGPTSSN